MHDSGHHESDQVTVKNGSPISFEDRIAAAREKREARIGAKHRPAIPATDRTRVAVALGLPIRLGSVADLAPTKADVAPPRARRTRGGLVAAAAVFAAIVALGSANAPGPPASAPLDEALLLGALPSPPTAPRTASSRQAFMSLAASERPQLAARSVEPLTRSAMRTTGPEVARPWTGRPRVATEPVARALPIRWMKSATATSRRADPPAYPARVSVDRVIQRAEASPAFRHRPAERPAMLASGDPPEAARATPPRTRPTLVPIEPITANSGRPSVFIHVPPGVPKTAVERISRGLSGVDPAATRVIPVAFSISSTHVRYYRATDARAAEVVRAAVARAYAGRRDGTPRDFSFYDPRPAPGTIEVWLQGG